MVLQNKFSASRFWPTIARHRVTWVSAVPAVMAILLQSEEETGATTVRFVRSASAPLPEHRLRQFEARCGVPVISRYAEGRAADSFDNGWFLTGDIGHQDTEGYVYIVSRASPRTNW